MLATAIAVLALAGCGGDDDRGGAPGWFPSAIDVPEGADFTFADEETSTFQFDTELSPSAVEDFYDGRLEGFDEPADATDDEPARGFTTTFDGGQITAVDSPRGTRVEFVLAAGEPGRP